MNGNESPNIGMIVFIIACILVASQPMWIWAGDEHPKLRFWGTTGLVTSIGAGILGTLFFSEQTTAILIVAGIPPALICWGWVICHYLWLVLRAGWMMFGVIALVAFGVGVVATLRTDMSWLEYWDTSKPYLLIVGFFAYLMACYRADIIGKFWSTDGSSHARVDDAKGSNRILDKMREREAKIRDIEDELQAKAQERIDGFKS